MAVDVKELKDLQNEAKKDEGTKTIPSDQDRAAFSVSPQQTPRPTYD